MDKYKSLMLKYGLIPMIMLIEHFEHEEKYEECDNIIKAIKYYEELLEEKLYTRITDECFLKVKETLLNVLQNNIENERIAEVYNNLFLDLKKEVLI